MLAIYLRHISVKEDFIFLDHLRQVFDDLKPVHLFWLENPEILKLYQMASERSTEKGWLNPTVAKA